MNEISLASVTNANQQEIKIPETKKPTKIPVKNREPEPIPLFSCLICANEFLVLSRYIRIILTKKYVTQSQPAQKTVELPYINDPFQKLKTLLPEKCSKASKFIPGLCDARKNIKYTMAKFFIHHAHEAILSTNYEKSLSGNTNQKSLFTRSQPPIKTIDLESRKTIAFIDENEIKFKNEGISTNNINNNSFGIFDTKSIEKTTDISFSESEHDIYSPNFNEEISDDEFINNMKQKNEILHISIADAETLAEYTESDLFICSKMPENTIATSRVFHKVSVPKSNSSGTKKSAIFSANAKSSNTISAQVTPFSHNKFGTLDLRKSSQYTISNSQFSDSSTDWVKKMLKSPGLPKSASTKIMCKTRNSQVAVNVCKTGYSKKSAAKPQKENKNHLLKELSKVSLVKSQTIIIKPQAQCSTNRENSKNYVVEYSKISQEPTLTNSVLESNQNIANCGKNAIKRNTKTGSINTPIYIVGAGKVTEKKINHKKNATTAVFTSARGSQNEKMIKQNMNEKPIIVLEKKIAGLRTKYSTNDLGISLNSHRKLFN